MEQNHDERFELEGPNPRYNVSGRTREVTPHFDTAPDRAHFEAVLAAYCEAVGTTPGIFIAGLMLDWYKEFVKSGSELSKVKPTEYQVEEAEDAARKSLAEKRRLALNLFIKYKRGVGMSDEDAWDKVNESYPGIDWLPRPTTNIQQSSQANSANDLSTEGKAVYNASGTKSGEFTREDLYAHWLMMQGRQDDYTGSERSNEKLRVFRWSQSYLEQVATGVYKAGPLVRRIRANEDREKEGAEILASQLNT